tara:strand:+ start:793 stop:1305 length:513 start_codon:yes stop_codon:yes gene_type:complete
MIKTYKDFFPFYVHDLLLQYLEITPFLMDPTYLTEDIDKSIPRLKATSYQGLIHKSWPEEKTSNLSLNTFAAMALIKIRKEEKKFFVLERVLFNYMTKDTVGQIHYDSASDDRYSFVLNLSESDGGTQIDNKFYKNNFNEGLLFKSKLLHQGVGPTNNLYRQNMALVFKE